MSADPPQMRRRPTVLVAVSSSPSGREALRRGVREARQMGARLQLIRVWRDIDRFLSMTRAEVSALRGQERAEEAILAEATARAKKLDHSLEVESRLVPGDLYDSLLDAAENADLLLVGAGAPEDRSSFIGEWFQRHAPCAVTIVDAPFAVPTHQ